MSVQENEKAFKETADESAPDPNLVCDRCGRAGAYTFGKRHVCLDCYEQCGSCCPEFGADDLWEFDKD